MDDTQRNIDLLNMLIETSVEVWTMGNNSGCNETLQACDKLHNDYMNDIERYVKEWFGVSKVDWPGLYPTFEDCEGYTHYDIESFLQHGKQPVTT